MIQAVLLFCCVLLSTSPRNAQEGALTFQLSFIETKHPLLSNQIPLPDPKTHQDLLCMVPTLASLPEYLSNLALEVALEEVGYLTEAHILQLQLAKMRGKDTTETLICESKKHNEEEANSIPDMCGLRFITVLVELLLCCFLLHAVDAISYGNKTKFLVHLPSSLGSWPPSSDPLSCETLLPKSLPGFTHMAPLPKFLIGLSLMIALEKAGCQADVQVLKLQLYRQGGINATEMLIRHLQELEKGRSSGRGVSADALSSALQQWAEEQTSPERARRSLSIKDCEHEKEQSVHNIVQLLPGVGTFYNLGTALYYAVQNCSDKAKERGRDGVIDLGYDLLTAMAGASGGPWGIVISTSLKPVVKSGIHRVIQYYNEREVKTPPPESSKEVLGSTIAIGDLEETATVTPLVSEVVSSPPYWWWTLFKGYNSDPGFGNPAI